MSDCYWCYWGWPKPIQDIYDKAVADLGGWEDPLEFGPAHILWSDENWDCVQWCLDHFSDNPSDYSDDQLAIVRRSLIELLAVPDEYKVEPADFNGQNPAAFPPPAEWGCRRAVQL